MRHFWSLHRKLKISCGEERSGLPIVRQKIRRKLRNLSTAFKQPYDKFYVPSGHLFVTFTSLFWDLYTTSLSLLFI